MSIFPIIDRKMTFLSRRFKQLKRFDDYFSFYLILEVFLKRTNKETLIKHRMIFQIPLQAGEIKDHRRNLGGLGCA
jgi:hypothetical protein